MNLHSGKFPFFELSADAMELRTFARRKKCTAAMSLHKEGNQVIAVFIVIGARDIRRAHTVLFHPTTRREQQKTETRQVNKRVRKLLISAAKRATNGAGK